MRIRNAKMFKAKTDPFTNQKLQPNLFYPTVQLHYITIDKCLSLAWCSIAWIKAIIYILCLFNVSWCLDFIPNCMHSKVLNTHLPPISFSFASISSSSFFYSLLFSIYHNNFRPVKCLKVRFPGNTLGRNLLQHSKPKAHPRASLIHKAPKHWIDSWGHSYT